MKAASIVAETILEIEHDLHLLDLSRYGKTARIAWEASRVPLFHSLSQNGATVARPQHDRQGKDRVRALGTWLVSLVSRNWLFAPRGREYLVVANSRRKRSPSGVYEDPYTDDIVAELGPDRTVVVESPNNNGHLSPTPSRVFGTEMQSFLSGLSKLWSPRAASPGIIRLARDVQDRLNSRFEDCVDVRALLRKRASAVRRSRVAYKIMLRWLRPSRILLVCSYGQEALILAARDLLIPTFEIQHGTITPFHLGYSVPVGATKLSFPDYLMLFGSYWAAAANLPLPADRLLVLGYPYFARSKRNISLTARSDQVVFVSQWTLSDEISRFAVHYAERKPAGTRMFYKLHPREAVGWRETLPWLARAARLGMIEVVEGDTPSLYELFTESQTQIGVYSTAIYEGLALGCRTYLLQLPGVEHMQRLVDEGLVTLVREPQEIRLSEVANVPAPGEVFDLDWKTRLRDIDRQSFSPRSVVQ